MYKLNSDSIKEFSFEALRYFLLSLPSTVLHMHDSPAQLYVDFFSKLKEMRWFPVASWVVGVAG